MAELQEVEGEGNSSNANMRTLRVPPVITVNKSAAYASYDLTYIRVCVSFYASFGNCVLVCSLPTSNRVINENAKMQVIFVRELCAHVI